MPPAFSGWRVPAFLATLAGLALAGLVGRVDAQPASAGPSPDLRSSCTPEPYPKAAATALAQGRTGLAYTIDADGRARDIVIEIPAGETPETRRLDVAAVHFLQGCRFGSGLADAARVRRTNYVWSLKAIGSDRWNGLGPEEPAIVETSPRAIPGSCAWPSWPASTRAKVDAHDVVVRARVEPTGNVSSVELLRTSGQPVIDDAVRSKLSTCRFEPARQSGVALWGRTWLTFPWHGDDLRPRFADDGPSDVSAALWAGPEGASPSIGYGGCARPDLSDVLPHELVRETVKIRLTFDDAGGVSRVEVLQASPHPAVDDRIVRSLAACTLQSVFGPDARNTGPRQIDYVYRTE